ncbi:MAG: hypothetical protein MUC66_00655, partial [Methanolinea sp.]|nr:hypothetical protein [Methanolinea sp.]
AIPDQVHLQANIRYFRDEVRDLILTSIARICKYTAMSAGIPEDRLPVITLLVESVPPLENDPLLTSRVISALTPCLGAERIHRLAPLTGSEDFGLFGKVNPPIPLCYLRLGTDEGQSAYLHSTRFSLSPEKGIRNGVTVMSLAALSLLGTRGDQAEQPSPGGGR